jgi:hypothetical protein
MGMSLRALQQYEKGLAASANVGAIPITYD